MGAKGKIYSPRSPEFINTADNNMVQGEKYLSKSVYNIKFTKCLFTLKGIKQIPKEHGYK